MWFTFEVFREGEAPFASCVLPVSDRREVWPQVEAIAALLGDRGKSYIRVRDHGGETIVRAGVATALASIKECSCTVCPLKRQIGHGAPGSDVAIPFLVRDRFACGGHNRVLRLQSFDSAVGETRQSANAFVRRRQMRAGPRCVGPSTKDMARVSLLNRAS